jgi:general secretion pathway protein C
MSAEYGNQKKSKSFLKTLLIYLFLLYLAFVTADIILLKFASSKFVVKMSPKDKASFSAGRESETSGFDISALGSKSTYTDRIVNRNIFNSKDMPPPIARLSNENENEVVEDDNTPVLSGLQLNLDGTLVHRNPFRSIATITGQGKTFSYSVGDEIDGMAEIVSVIRKKVIIRNLQNRRLEYIEIKRDQKRPERPVARRRMAPPPKPSSDLIQRDGNRFTARRADVNAQLANISSLARQAKSKIALDPATGETLGYQIFDIQPGLLKSLGVQDNDIITSVNGMPIKSQLQATSAFSKLKSANEINVVINRGGSPVELEYVIE